MHEFQVAVPVEVAVTDLSDERPVDVAVIGNCVSYDESLIPHLPKRVVWMHNDLSPHIDPALKGWLDRKATHVFCSPLQRDRYGHDGHLIPPAIDLKRFKPSRQVKRNGDRKGMVALGAWQNQGKGQQGLLEHARKHGQIDVYGTGAYAPTQPPLNFVGAVDYKDVPELLWGYETFVHLPWEVEPFGRAVVEAHAAGLDIVANRNVGALYWLNEAPEKLTTAAEDFWELVCAA